MTRQPIHYRDLPPTARVVNGCWTVPCNDGCKGTGRWSICTVRGLRRLRPRRAWWGRLAWPYDAAVALKRRQCVACKGTGRTTVTLAAPQTPVERIRISNRCQKKLQVAIPEWRRFRK